MALRKAFPTERNYDFWNILLCFLVERDDRATDKERTLFGMLAYRLVSKAAEAAPTDNVSGSIGTSPYVALQRVLIKLRGRTAFRTLARALYGQKRSRSWLRFT